MAPSKPLSIYNNYGGTIGGTDHRKNKLFYFFSFDGTRQRTARWAPTTVPTADMRAGDFSTYTTIIYDPATGNPDGTGRTPFAGNMFPTNRISPIALKIQSYYPAPRIWRSCANNYFASAARFNRDYNDTKINYNRNEKQQIFGHYGIMKALVVGKDIFGDGVGPAPGADPGMGDTQVQTRDRPHHVISPTLLLDGVIGYQRQDQTVKGVDFGKDFGDTLGIPGLMDPTRGRAASRTSTINSYDGFGVPGWMPAFRVEENVHTSANLTWTKRQHALRFGFNGAASHDPLAARTERAVLAAALSFNGGTNRPERRRGREPTSTGYAAFLLGLSDDVQKSHQYILMTLASASSAGMRRIAGRSPAT